MPAFANIKEFLGTVFCIRKSSASNTLTLSGDFESGATVNLTTLKTYVFIVGQSGFIDITP